MYERIKEKGPAKGHTLNTSRFLAGVKITIFTTVKCCSLLQGHVCVMIFSIESSSALETIYSFLYHVNANYMQL